jgi:hypothetical protein
MLLPDYNKSLLLVKPFPGTVITAVIHNNNFGRAFGMPATLNSDW